jgi:hypothetical protein
MKIVISSRSLSSRILPDRAPGLRVQADRRFVEEQHARGMHEAAGDLQPAAHAARERSDHGVLAVPQPDHRHHLAHPGRDEIGLHAVQVGVQAQVLGSGQVAVERRVLEDEADVAADVVALGDHIMPRDPGLARRRARQRAQHVDRGRLAGPVWA